MTETPLSSLEFKASIVEKLTRRLMQERQTPLSGQHHVITFRIILNPWGHNLRHSVTKNSRQQRPRLVFHLVVACHIYIYFFFFCGAATQNGSWPPNS